ncbi:hypothetical protein SAMN04487891_108168 [Flagellimonas taeanensis]|uniref:Uncharacterized protein n=1 Tax=Flagellimonas taeanensis TaxID=1005926 RepID=A0A1M6ZQ33_9FLAO|nr:hypothetical protein [Allomuricauda taeanensis]SFC29639.1 hypothetical protein SAMN04487891_108168 [Allomuricauda taeanensis]SHL32556.1 hypothetical protein SAMN05216293_3199 [Allomuricauda taeanensis]
MRNKGEFTSENSKNDFQDLLAMANEYFKDKADEKMREKETLIDKLKIHINGKEITMENYSKR